MKKYEWIDLTALLDVILIILFAVMMQMHNQATDVADAFSQTETALDAQTLTLEALSKELDETLTAYQHQTAINQQQDLQIEALIDILAPDTRNIEDLSIEHVDRSAMLRNIHKYDVIANKFLFIDLTVDLETGTLYIDDQATNLVILEADGFNEQRFQQKREAIVIDIHAYIQTINDPFSFILITIAYDPRVTNRYYITLIADAIRSFRDQHTEFIVFDTRYLIDSD